MPKRKRMSFTVKRNRISSTPVKASPVQKRSELQGTRPRGRPPKKAKLDTESPLPRRRNASEKPEEATGLDDEEREPSEPEVEDAEEVEVESERNEEAQEEATDQARSSTDRAKPQKSFQPTAAQKGKAKEKSTPAATSATSTSTIAYVPKTTVEKKWQRADAETQTQIRSLLTSASVSTIAARLGPASSNSTSLAAVESAEGRGAEEQAAIHQAVRALERRLPRMPFPPRTEDGMFEHEGLLRDHSALQAQVRAQAADIAALEAELARVRAGLTDGEKAAEKSEKEYKKEKTALEKRQKGRFGKLLKPAKKEPADSARRIKLAAWSGPRSGDGNAGHGGGTRRLVQEARLLVGQLQDRRADDGTGSNDMGDTDELLADVDRVAEAIENVIRAKRREPALQSLAVG